jgi:hypothetical protein
MNDKIHREIAEEGSASAFSGGRVDARGEMPDMASFGVDASRRRLARAGIAVPVILGTLASRPVLGADPAYDCTVSGQLSGNVSPRPGTGTVCSSIGSSKSFWLASNAWPSSIIKGTLPNGSCNFVGSGGSPGTYFNAFSSGTNTLANAFFAASSGSPPSCSVVTNVTTQKATMYQVLASTQSGPLFDLGRATVVSLLNAASVGSSYPVTAATIVAMFNATYLGGTFQINSTVSWTESQVISYLTSLYPTG